MIGKAHWQGSHVWWRDVVAGASPSGPLYSRVVEHSRHHPPGKGWHRGAPPRGLTPAQEIHALAGVSGIGGPGAQGLVTNAAAGAAMGAPLGPPGMAAGAALSVVSSFFGGGAGKTSHMGPGSLTWWTAQLKRLQAIMNNPSVDDSVRQAARDLANAWKAKNTPQGGDDYPIIPEGSIVALERQAQLTPKTVSAGFDLKSGAILVGGLVLIGLFNLARQKARSRRR